MSSNATPGLPPAGSSRPRGPMRWIVIGLAVVALAAALTAGLLPRLSAKEELKKQARELNVPTVAVIQPKRGEAQPGADPPREHRGLRRDAHLRPDQRLSDALAGGHRRARAGRAAAGRDRNSRGGRPAAAGARGALQRAGQLPDRRQDRYALERAGADRQCLQAGRRPGQQHHAGAAGGGGLRSLQRRTPREAAGLQTRSMRPSAA